VLDDEDDSVLDDEEEDDDKEEDDEDDGDDGLEELLDGSARVELEDEDDEDDEDELDEDEIDDPDEEELLSLPATWSEPMAVILAQTCAVSSSGMTAAMGYGHGVLPARMGMSVRPYRHPSTVMSLYDCTPSVENRYVTRPRSAGPGVVLTSALARPDCFVHSSRHLSLTLENAPVGQATSTCPRPELAILVAPGTPSAAPWKWSWIPAPSNISILSVDGTHARAPLDPHWHIPVAPAENGVTVPSSSTARAHEASPRTTRNSVPDAAEKSHP